MRQESLFLTVGEPAELVVMLGQVLDSSGGILVDVPPSFRFRHDSGQEGTLAGHGGRPDLHGWEHDGLSVLVLHHLVRSSAPRSWKWMSERKWSTPLPQSASTAVCSRTI